MHDNHITKEGNKVVAGGWLAARIIQTLNSRFDGLEPHNPFGDIDIDSISHSRRESFDNYV